MSLLKFAFLFVIGLNVTVDISHKILLQNIAFKVFSGSEQVIWISIINALIILPFLLLFSYSGFLSDRFDKIKILKLGALSSFVLSLIMVSAYLLNSFYFAMFGLLLLAVQAAVYSPAKFGLIKTIYTKDNLSSGNAHVQVVSILSLLFTMGLFSFLFEKMASTNLNTVDLMNSLIPLSLCILGISFLELFTSVLLLRTTSSFDSNLTIDKNDLFKGKIFIKNIKDIKNNEVIFLSVIGLSVFWGLSQGMMAVFPSFAKETLNLTNVFLINAILGISGIGIACGSFVYSKMSKHYIDVSPLAFSALGITISIYLSTIISNVYFLGFIFFLFGFFGGIFVVTLNSLIQFNSEDHNLGTILAGNNWFQSFFMFSILCLTTFFAFNNFEPIKIIYILLCISFIGTLYIMFKLPESILRFILKISVGFKFKLEVFGLKNIPSSGPCLVLGNHISWLDWAIVILSLPRRTTFVMDKNIYNKWFLNWFLKSFSIIPINQSGKDSIKLIASKLDAGDLVVLFPEGAITRTGHLGEFKKGFEKILSLTTVDVSVHSFYIKGLWETMFGRSNKQFRKSSKTNIVSISYSKAFDKTVSSEEIKKEVLSLSNNVWQEHIKNTETIPNEIFNSMKRIKNSLAVADLSFELSGYKFLTSCILFKDILRFRIEGQNVGLLIPSSVVGSFVNTAVLMLGKTVINLNYTSDIESLKHALKQANIKTIITSKLFISKLSSKGININEILSEDNTLYLEDLKKEVYKFDQIFTYFKVKLFPTWLLKLIYVKNVKKDSNACILFSSGSEGSPKGVELSHVNIIGNIKQVASILNVDERDTIVGSLPLFHAFGISITTFLPLVEGISMVCHPDPTDGLSLGKLIFKYQATIMCGTSTFFRLYSMNKKIHPQMFSSLRLIVAGAEKLNPEVKTSFKNRFGKDILEGYGTTETSPVATCNIPEILAPDLSVQTGFKIGSVGMPIPGTSIKIVDPDTFEELNINQDGMILISGVQIMKGYLSEPEKTNSVLKEIDNKIWYITGDKGHIDEDGFLFIVDRYSRFAKLGGEMISLGSIETKINPFISSETDFIITSIPDEKKGEKIILLISNISEEDLNLLKSKFNELFENKLMIPSVCQIVKEIPKLGSGKKDFKGAKQLALSL